MSDYVNEERHKQRINWFWSVVGGLCALVFVFAISSWIDNVHEEWMRCYALQEKLASISTEKDKYASSSRYYCD